eukprot:746864-Hanusia_phi.AAC.3
MTVPAGSASVSKSLRLSASDRAENHEGGARRKETGACEVGAEHEPVVLEPCRGVQSCLLPDKVDNNTTCASAHSDTERSFSQVERFRPSPHLQRSWGLRFT